MADLRARGLTDDEAELALSIVCWLKKEMISRLEQYPEPGLLYDMAQSNFERACAALERAGQLSQEKGYWRILWNEDSETHLPHDIDRDDLDLLLDALICQWDFLAGRWLADGPVIESEEIRKRATENALRDIAQNLVRCGYAAKKDTGEFVWTDRAGPWLIFNCIWDLYRFEPYPDEVVDRVVSELHENILKWLSSSDGHFQPYFARCLFWSWDKNGRNDSEPQDYPNDEWDLPLATALYIRLH